MFEILADFEPGPLDYYRKKASFDWKKLKVHILTEAVTKFENDLYEEYRNHPEFQKDLLSCSLDEEKRRISRQTLAHRDNKLADLSHLLSNVKFPATFGRVIMQLSPAACIKYNVGMHLFNSVVRALGSERHHKFVEEAELGNISGCYCLTEVGHGSNTKGMRTTAVYDKERKQFILHTPDFQAAKCWSGGLGKTASHAVVYAQLYVDGVHHGLHVFVVQLRDPKTLLPCPGVIVGDMGEKIGLNGVDNGVLMFDHYPIPCENILDKTGDVTEDGRYVQRFKTSKERSGASFAILSVGRINITSECESMITKAITIAVRYAAVRKQFGPDGKEEVPILEYQTHQHRLFPYLAASYAFRILSGYLMETLHLAHLGWENKEELAALGMELHGLSSTAKVLTSWISRDGIQECRESCGGHGYLKVAGLGDLRNDNDASTTYEGDNHVMVQQTSNWLLKLWPLVERGQKVAFPLKSTNFLGDASRILNHKFSATTPKEACLPENIIDAFQWLVCYYLKETKSRADLRTKTGEDPFWVKNNTQVFYAKNLSIAYVQHFILQRMLVVANEATDDSIKNVLLKLLSMYGLWSLEKFLPTLYEGGYAVGASPANLVHDAILQLCEEIKNDAVSLVDAIAPPDFILNSALGASDGQVYKRLQSAMFRNPYSMSRPEWWQEIVGWKTSIRNKM